VKVGEGGLGRLENAEVAEARGHAGLADVTVEKHLEEGGYEHSGL
jgi:hypothetical protein